MNKISGCLKLLKNNILEIFDVSEHSCGVYTTRKDSFDYINVTKERVMESKRFEKKAALKPDGAIRISKFDISFVSLGTGC